MCMSFQVVKLSIEKAFRRQKYISQVWSTKSLWLMTEARIFVYLRENSTYSFETMHGHFAFCALILGVIRPKKYIYVFQVSRPYLGFCPDPKHFIVNCEQNVVKFAGKWGKIYGKMQFLSKIFWQNKMLYRPTIHSFFRAETWNTQFFFFCLRVTVQNWSFSFCMCFFFFFCMFFFFFFFSACFFFSFFFGMFFFLFFLKVFKNNDIREDEKSYVYGYVYL